MCNKIGYSTKSKAKKDIDSIQKRNRTKKFKVMDFKKLKTYECPFCGQWHLTTHKKHKWSKQK